jgi:hypothetical protein
MSLIGKYLFPLESYFRNKVKLKNGEWSSSVQDCFEELHRTDNLLNIFESKTCGKNFISCCDKVLY